MTRRQQATAAAAAAVVFGAVIIGERGGIFDHWGNPISSIQAPPYRQIFIQWDNPPDMPPGTVTEIWESSNLVAWQLRTNRAGVPGSSIQNRVIISADKPAAFFKVRNRETNGAFSDWSRQR